MGKRYYCDYCDRSFQDNMHNRKKHLNGVQHHRAKKAWFGLFRDSAAILSEEQAKMPCRKFLQTGNCGFGPGCRFSHMSEEELEHLKRQVEGERQCGDDLDDGTSPEPNIEEWLCRMEKKRAIRCGGGVVEEKDGDEDNQTEDKIPPQLLSIPDLPPSLLPPPRGGWRVKFNSEWG